MDQYELIRTAKRAYGKSIRQIARDTGHHRVTIRKVLRGEEPKYRRRKRVKCAVMDAVAGVVQQWLREDRSRPKKQRHTARRIYRLVSIRQPPRPRFVTIPSLSVPSHEKTTVKLVSKRLSWRRAGGLTLPLLLLLLKMSKLPQEAV